MARQIRHHIKELEPQQRLQVEFEAIKSTPPDMPAHRRQNLYLLVGFRNTFVSRKNDVLDGGVI